MYITVNDSKEMPQYNEEDGRQYLVSKNQSRQIYPIRLIPNQMNYIHICNYTYSSNNGPDYFNIYSVKLEESVIKERFENVYITKFNDKFFIKELIDKYL